MAIDRDKVVHRSGEWKQSNKTHKHGNHRSKGAVEAASKGRVSVKVLTKRARHVIKRCDRIYQAKKRRAQKREEVLLQKRSLGTQNSPPFLVAIVPINGNEDPKTALEALKKCDDTAVVTTSKNGKCCHIGLHRFKQRFCFFIPRPGDLHAILDAAKVADTVLLLYSLDLGIDETGQLLLSALFAQGLPTTVHAVQLPMLSVYDVHATSIGGGILVQFRNDVGHLPMKRRHESLKAIQKIVDIKFHKEKIMPLDTPQEALLVMRQIGNRKQRRLTYRDKRPHLLSEHTEWNPSKDRDNEGTLIVSGYIRGQPLDVNSLVHITGWGDFQLARIETPRDPQSTTSARNRKDSIDAGSTSATDKMEDVNVNIQPDPARQVSLQAENDIDPMDGEQTWPTEDEIRDAEADQPVKKIVKMVPKGTSSYQAEWILDSDESSGDDDDYEADSDDSEYEDAMQGIEAMDEEVSEAEEDAEEYETITLSEVGDDTRYDELLDEDEDKKALEKFKAARMEAMFPDEVDTPMDVLARIRFQKYRGLGSFRTSPWDPKENLPLDYARIFQFQNYDRTRKRVFAGEREGVTVGMYVTIHVANVPRHLFVSHDESTPLVLYGLLSHEHKMSVLNMAIKRVPYEGEEEPIKSKDRLIFHVGYRRFCACPIFSQHTNGKKHKYERFFEAQSAAMVASVYAPIMFSPASVLVFREKQDGQHQLVATGAVLSVNPNRIVAKRVVLSGHLYKIAKKTVTVRYMFFKREDINWFKPIELRTKRGRHGHIRGPIGTHGHMKCVFDSHLSSEDIVLMNLYKRVYPKWNYDPFVPAPPVAYLPIDTVID